MSSGSQASHDEFVVVDDGRSSAEIRWWSGDDESVASFTASELQSYVERIAGDELPTREAEVMGEVSNEVPSLVCIVSDDSSHSNTTIPADCYDVAADRLADSTPDGFVLQTVESGLVLAGSTHRGTLHAAYELLERLGVRFFAPDFDFYDGHAEQCPSRKTVRIEPLDVFEEPSLTYRRKYIEAGWSHTANNLPQLVDWLAKTRHNVLVCPADYSLFGSGVTTWDAWRDDLLPELEKRGLQLEVGGHGFDSFLSPEEYGEDHPEWFFEDSNVFNIADDDAVDTYVENVIEYLDDRSEIDIFDAWPPDAISEWPTSVINELGSIANAYARVVNRLQEALEESLPERDVTIEMIAYSSHNDVPDPEYMYDEEVLVDFAPNRRSFATPLSVGGDETNDRYSDRLHEWREQFDGPIVVYEYYRQYSWHSLPLVLPGLFESELTFYDETGATGIGTYSEPGDWITYELSHLVIGALSWDTDLQIEPYVDRYLNERYGDAAAAMSRYYRLVEEAGRVLFGTNRGTWDDGDAVSLARDLYDQARRTLGKARDQVAGDSTAIFLLKRLEPNAEFAVLDTEMSLHELRNDPDRAAEARRKLTELVESHRFGGAILDSRWMYMRHSNNLDAGGTGLTSEERKRLEAYRSEWG